MATSTSPATIPHTFQLTVRLAVALLSGSFAAEGIVVVVVLETAPFNRFCVIETVVVEPDVSSLVVVTAFVDIVRARDDVVRDAVVDVRTVTGAPGAAPDGVDVRNIITASAASPIANATATRARRRAMTTREVRKVLSGSLVAKAPV